MDAEIWSYADMKNGRLILLALTIAVLLKELAVLALPFLGLPAVDPIWAAGSAAAGAFTPLRGVLILAIKLILLLSLYAGFSWARLGLALIYLFTSIYAVALTLTGPDGLQAPGPLLTLANGAAGILIAAVLLLSPRLKAYLWRKASTRLIIPIPGEDEPPEPRGRRTHTLGETVMIAIQRLVSLVILTALLGAVAHLYGLTNPLLEALGR